MSIKVLIVDDSAVVRTILSKLLNSTPDITVIATAHDPIFALKHLQTNKPDVIILDVEMPRMDGISFLKKIMSENPIPVVMCSTLTERSSATSIQALSIGAIDVIEKPKSNLKESLGDSAKDIIEAVRNAARANLSPVTKVVRDTSSTVITKPKPASSEVFTASQHIVAIGTSTGGTQALEVILPKLPISCPGIVIVQHMPATFTAAFAERLNTLSSVHIKEGENGDVIEKGKVLIAPGGKHMQVAKNSKGQPYITVKEGPLVSRHCPSVDVLFRSVAKTMPKQALGIIMTGMGDDGAIGLKEMKDAGAQTLAQDESSCVIYGMPAAAVSKGATCKHISLYDIPSAIVNFK